MKKIVALNLVALAAMGMTAQANAYQAEINGAYMNMDNDVVDNDMYQVGGEFYVDGVQASSGPFVEAAFLDQATSLRANYLNNDTSDVDGVVLGGRFVDKNSGLLFEADASTGDLEGYQVGLGMYIDTHSTITAQYYDQQDSAELASGYGVTYKNLMTNNNGTYFNMEASAQYLDNDFDEEFNSFEVAGDYYFNKMMGLGLNVAVNGGDIDSTEYGINGSMFLAQNVTLEASLTQEDFDDTNQDETSFLVGGKVRF